MNYQPTIKHILESLNSNGYSVNTNLDSDQLEFEGWTNFELTYKNGKLPILVELNHVGDSDGLAKDEIEEFKDSIGKPGLFEFGKKKVLKHLDQTYFILSNQLPTSDIDDDGYDVNGELMSLFVSKCNGMIQCDGEGFYSGVKLVVEEE